MQLSSLLGLLVSVTAVLAQEAPKPCAQEQGLFNACVASWGGTGGCRSPRLNGKQSRECIKRCDDNSGYTLCTKEGECKTKHDTCMSRCNHCNTDQDKCLVDMRAKFGPPETE